jgi:hypothetical protein
MSYSGTIPRLISRLPWIFFVPLQRRICKISTEIKQNNEFILEWAARGYDSFREIIIMVYFI